MGTSNLDANNTEQIEKTIDNNQLKDQPSAHHLVTPL